MKKALSFLLTVIFVMSLSILVYANEEKSTEQIPSSEYSNEIKSAEKSVYDFFMAVQKKDYDTINRISKNKWMSKDVLRNTIELDHEQGMIPEKVTILSSEKCGKDMVNVKVRYVLAGEEYIKTYPVVLVNNEWIVNVGDAVDPSVVIMETDRVHVPDYSTMEAPPVSYSKTLNIGLRCYVPCYMSNSAKTITLLGYQNNSRSVNVSYGIKYLNALNDWMPTGKPTSVIKQNNYVDYHFFQSFKEILGPNLVYAMEINVTRNGTNVWGTIYDTN